MKLFIEGRRNGYSPDQVSAPVATPDSSKSVAQAERYTVVAVEIR